MFYALFVDMLNSVFYKTIFVKTIVMLLYHAKLLEVGRK